MATDPTTGTGQDNLGPDEVYQLLRQNNTMPHGRARIVRAEELTELAGRTGDGQILVIALQELVRAYNNGGEQHKILVPFARLLHMWDTDPSDFGDGNIHRLHWHFKWATSGMIVDPRVPLATIEEWLGVMETRYQLAGYGTRAVRQAEFEIARHIGDQERAGVAFDRWLASDRDEMSDCQACERRAQGRWRVEQGDDSAALDFWAPVLDGELTCEAEPHDTLSSSLLPLLRLGHPEQARANHLRGYRMARGVPDLRGAVGRHVEFCALSGNEARGLEIMADHASWFDVEAMVADQLEFLRGCAVLLRRLDMLGHGDRSVPMASGPDGRVWTVRTLRQRVERDLFGLADRFDQRNGTDAVGQRVRAGLDRVPLVDRLPLGLRVSPAVGTAPAADNPVSGPTSVGTGTEATQTDLSALVERARELSRVGRPAANAAWRRVAAVSVGRDLDPVARAELADRQGRWASAHGADEARRLFLDAAERFDQVGLPGRAACSRARAAIAAAVGEAGGTPWGESSALTDADAAVAAVTGLADSGAADPDDVMTVRMCRATVLLVGVQHLAAADDGQQDPDATTALVAELNTELDRVTALAEEHDDTTLMASARRIHAQYLMFTGELDQAQAVLREAIDSAGAADMPWLAGDLNLLLAQIHLARGELDQAEQVARAALATELDTTEQGQVRLLLAETLARQDRYEEAAASALDAAHWFDTAAEPEPASHARVLLAQTYRALGRSGEAAAILEETLPDVVAYHDEFDTARVRQTLAHCLTDLNEHRAAAEQLLLAADTAQTWPDQTPHAMLASDAARELAAAGMVAEATRAFERATGLWHDLGQIGPYIRTLRATAWHVHQQDANLDRALELMAQASQALSDVDDEVDSEGFDRDFEVAETFDQTARLLADAASDADQTVDGDLAERALRHALRAVEGFHRCGDERWDDLVSAQYLAAQIEAHLLGRGTDAERRLRDLIAACEHHGGESADQWEARCRSTLEEISDR